MIHFNHLLSTPSSGEIVGLIGPSGTGKTTLIQCMLGMEKVNSGEVVINGTTIPDRKILGDIGYMAQNDALYEDLTGKENLKFFASKYTFGNLECMHNYPSIFRNTSSIVSASYCRLISSGVPDAMISP